MNFIHLASVEISDGTSVSPPPSTHRANGEKRVAAWWVGAGSVADAMK